MKYKRIDLLPSKWFVDIWITKNYKTLCNNLSKKYGGSFEFWKNEINETQTVLSYENFKGHKYIICCLYDFDLSVIIHESVHITWHLQDKVNFDYENDQELQAYYVEYIVEEILKMDKAKQA